MNNINIPGTMINKNTVVNNYNTDDYSIKNYYTSTN